MVHIDNLGARGIFLTFGGPWAKKVKNHCPRSFQSTLMQNNLFFIIKTLFRISNLLDDKTDLKKLFLKEKENHFILVFFEIFCQKCWASLFFYFVVDKKEMKILLNNKTQKRFDEKKPKQKKCH